MAELKNVAVLGAGVMGSQIGLLCAECGFNVKIRDMEEKFLDAGRKIIDQHLGKRVKKNKMTEDQKTALMGSIVFTTDLKEAVKDADYIVEAITEVMKYKQSVFKEAYEYAPKHTVFGTNTSAFLISEIASAIPEPERVIGVHFFNPPGSMPLLEIIYGDKTNEETIRITEAFSKQIRRINVVCRKDTAAFVTTRILMVMINESVWSHDLEGADKVEVDAALKYRMGMPMGMFELSDVLGGGGIELHQKIGPYLQAKLGESYRNSPIIQKMYDAGQLGVKVGRGFYDWTKGRVEIPFKAARNFDPIRIFAPLINDTAKMVENGFMSKEEVDLSCTLGLGFPRGIFRLADSIGLDKVVLEVKRLHEMHKEARYEVSPWLEGLVGEGKLGRKTGEGIYTYGPGEYELIKYKVDPESRVATITINRPNRANSLNLDCYTEIGKALDDFEADEGARCLVITGAGKVFCAGADVSMFGSGDTRLMVTVLPPIQNLLNRLETMGKPVVAAINGACMGGGLELAVACDMRIASSKAVMGFAEANLGLFPGTGGTQRVTRLIGLARAKEMVLTGQSITPAKALEWGLINGVAEPQDFDAKVLEMAKALADRASLGQSIAKRVMYYGAQADQQTAIVYEGASFPPVILSDEANEGITALMYRREPKF